MMKLKTLKTVFTNSNGDNDGVVETKKRDAVHAAGNVDHHHHHHHHDLILPLLHNQHNLLNLVDPPSVAIGAIARVGVVAVVEAPTRGVVDRVRAAAAVVVPAVALALRMTVVIDDGDDAVGRYRREAAVPVNPRKTVDVHTSHSIFPKDQKTPK